MVSATQSTEKVDHRTSIRLAKSGDFVALMQHLESMTRPRLSKMMHEESYHHVKSGALANAVILSECPADVTQHDAKHRAIIFLRTAYSTIYQPTEGGFPEPSRAIPTIMKNGKCKQVIRLMLENKVAEQYRSYNDDGKVIDLLSLSIVLLVKERQNQAQLKAPPSKERLETCEENVRALLPDGRIRAGMIPVLRENHFDEIADLFNEQAREQLLEQTAGLLRQTAAISRVTPWRFK